MTNLETARRVIDIRTRKFSETQERKYREQEYLERGLNNRSFVRVGNSGVWTIRGYSDEIGDMGGFGLKPLPELIDEKIEKNGKIRILDVGCGRGRFLIDCKKRWGDKVEGVGITADPRHIDEVSGDLRIGGVEQAPTRPELERLGIPIIIGDVQRLSRELRVNNIPGNFDLAVSVFVLQYLSDPLAAIKGIHASLANDGIGIISPHHFKYNTAWQSLELLEDQGVRINRDVVTVSKNSSHLSMPVGYDVSPDGRIGYVPLQEKDMASWNKSFIIPL